MLDTIDLAASHASAHDCIAVEEPTDTHEVTRVLVKRPLGVVSLSEWILWPHTCDYFFHLLPLEST